MTRPGRGYETLSLARWTGGADTSNVVKVRKAKVTY
jgi:hypothetical protein